MSLCYTEIKNQVKGLSEYKKKHVQFDSMVLLKSFRKIVYTGGSNNLHINHNKAMSPANFMSLYQEHFQDIQDLRAQYIALHKVCEELGLERMQG